MQGNAKSPTKYFLRKTISVLETGDGEYIVDPLQDAENQESGDEEDLSPKINTLQMKEDTSDEESDYGYGFQNLGYCAESFFRCLDQQDPIDSIGPILQVGHDARGKPNRKNSINTIHRLH